MDVCDTADMNLSVGRLGTRSVQQDRHRPAMVLFDTVEEKHTFIKHIKQLKPTGVKWDDCLTRQQQKE